ncbi:cbb3-type cytochrome c oxidase N-terminal domain-containing protein [Flavobacterium terrigena]|uniref:Cytochrome c oxidase cbb3-type subunit 3 n=1 Tax=Flavobacterium terrigena TaxID=402734 RepID=A0A1H6UEZ9_9FLAO|nr:cbb3-type cytochrome c oxidase N-terminal domain-containing protein [Flavobacterium terrigena]SEI90206.1 cytochrome c oxidase cbb3-type subunit 3 [Flavobacterium terrigena]
MRRYIPVYVRFPFFYAMVFALTEYFIDSGDRPAFLKYPIVPIIHLFLIFMFITVEIIMKALDSISYHLLTAEDKEIFDIESVKPFTQSAFYKKWMFKISALKPIENEKDIQLDHDYDGIKELDNGLPPWFTGLFYATIVFALVYLVRFHVIGDYTQEQEYVIENTLAEKKVEEYNKTAPDLMNIDKVTQLTETSDIAEGKAIFTTNCVLCHKADGGGAIGPNLTDANWINGGGIKNLFKTISEGGRPGKGMVAWKESLKPTEIQKVASYVMSLQGTKPAAGKAPEGEVWKEGGAAKPTTADVAVTDTIAKK